MISRHDRSRFAPSLILSSAAILVPRASRAEWLEDWKTELWYVERESARAPKADRAVLLFCLGAFLDALWLLRDGLYVGARRKNWLQTPRQCLLFLAMLVAALISGLFYRPWFARLLGERGFLPAALLLMSMSILVLPAVVPFDFSNFSLNCSSHARGGRVRRWTFLLTKFALVVLVLCCVFFYLTMIPKVALVGADLMTFIGVLSFRWVVRDQRRRCPVCLRALTGETRVAKPFRMFHEWYGSRHFCPQGHGSLYVSEADSVRATADWSERAPDVLGPALL